MPLRYADPNKKRGPLFRTWERIGRSRAGQAYTRRGGRRFDLWFQRKTGRSFSSLVGSVEQASLVSIGAKSNQPRVVQLAYFHDGDTPILVASNFGGAKNPQWYHNLKAHPECEFGDELLIATEILDPDEYRRVYALAEKSYAGWSDYRVKTDAIGRHIPLFRLTPR